MSEFPLTSRRGFLRTAAVLLPADGLAGCEGGKQPSSEIAQQGGQPASDAAPLAEVEYKPRFFDAREWAFLQAAVDRLIPADAYGPIYGATGAIAIALWVRVRPTKVLSPNTKV
ncbi:hypothetical protein OKW50_005024 [Paraburkholderia youngii]